MIDKLIPLYEQEPDKLAALHDQLSGVHANLPKTIDDEGPVAHTARYGDWGIVLRTSREGELLDASATRLAVEQYTFERTGGKTWSASGIKTRFPEAHFYNLVNLATRQGLEWTESPSA